jgi:succinate dehydrogenase/fumarate reductase flavoprotein subunit
MSVTEQKWAFEIPPDPIPDSEITETVESEVVVIGGGTSGLVTAVRLAEQGVKVVLIAASETPVGRGGSTFAMGSKLMEEKGVSIDVHKAYKKMMGYHSFRVDQNKWWLHANRSPEAMNWLIDKMTAAEAVGGVNLTPVLEAHFEDEEEITSEYWGTHDFIGGPNAPTSTRENPQQDVVENLLKHAEALGVQAFYSTTGRQLVREDGGKGRVTAVIADNPDYKKVKYVGSKAVIIATGDFGQDKDMVHKYGPRYIWDLTGGVYSGDGHKMALWVGAAWQKNGETAPLVFNFQYCQITNQVRAFSGLVVNKEGIRFEDEDNVVSHGALACLNQTNHASYAIWDTAYAKNGPWGYDYYGGPKVAGEDGQLMIEKWDKLVETSGEQIPMNGTSFVIDIVKGDDIKALAEQMGLPGDEVAATVERYNGYCASGIDEEYHKRPGLLLPVSTPPYYICRCEPWFLSTTGGLHTNINMQVLDDADAVIPGLYAVGTVVGDMYSNCYSTHFPGHNLGGPCLTFGYVTAEYIASNG